jgi:hypothetical protein
MSKRFVLAVVAVTFAVCGAAQAQVPKKGPHGGKVVSSEGHPIEFVNSGQQIVFYFSDDDGSPLSTRGMTGRAVVQDGGKTTTVPLAAAQPNKLVGKLQAPLGAKARVVLSATLSAEGHSHTLQGRFTTD